MVEWLEDMLPKIAVYSLFFVMIVLPLVFSLYALYQVREIQEVQSIIISNQRDILQNQQTIHSVLDVVVTRFPR